MIWALVGGAVAVLSVGLAWRWGVEHGRRLGRLDERWRIKDGRLATDYLEGRL